MYGTVARMRVKPGMEARFTSLFAELESVEVPGAVGEYLYRMDENESEYFMAVAFADRASYLANADSPAQDARYRQLRALLEADPEWHDGEIVFSVTAN
jgi:quinol monooxygenase YgiN